MLCTLSAPHVQVLMILQYTIFELEMGVEDAEAGLVLKGKRMIWISSKNVYLVVSLARLVYATPQSILDDSLSPVGTLFSLISNKATYKMEREHAIT